MSPVVRHLAFNTEHDELLHRAYSKVSDVCLAELVYEANWIFPAEEADYLAMLEAYVALRWGLS